MRENIDKYKSILHLPHPVSKKYPGMSDYDRAAQFAPFAALTGFDDQVEEAGKNHKTEEPVYVAEEDSV